MHPFLTHALSSQSHVPQKHAAAASLSGSTDTAVMASTPDATAAVAIFGTVYDNQLLQPRAALPVQDRTATASAQTTQTPDDQEAAPPDGDITANAKEITGDANDLKTPVASVVPEDTGKQAAKIDADNPQMQQQAVPAMGDTDRARLSSAEPSPITANTRPYAHKDEPSAQNAINSAQKAEPAAPSAPKEPVFQPVTAQHTAPGGQIQTPGKLPPAEAKILRKPATDPAMNALQVPKSPARSEITPALPTNTAIDLSAARGQIPSAVQVQALWQVQQTTVQTMPRELPRSKGDSTALETVWSVKPKPPATAITPMQLTGQKPTFDGAQDPKALSNPLTEADSHPLTRHDSHASAATLQVQTTAARMDLPQHVARQIADALQHMPNRPVEITLNPEELGRVRLGIASADSGIIVNVLAERPETVELMRRHISQLEAAFEAIGYRDISFAFSSGGSATADSSDDSGQPSGARDDDFGAQTPAETAQIHLSPQAVTGLDIRF